MVDSTSRAGRPTLPPGLSDLNLFGTDVKIASKGGDPIIPEPDSLITSRSKNYGDKSPSLDPKSQDRLTGAAASLREALDELRGLLGGASDSDMLARLLIEMSGMQRQIALDQRQSARAAARSSLEEQADATRNAAIMEIAGAVVSLVAAAANLGVSIKGLADVKTNLKEALSSGQKAQDAAGKAMKAQDAGDAAKAETLWKSEATLNRASDMKIQEVTRANLKSGAISQIVEASGNSIGGGLGGGAKLAEAEGMEDAAAAQDSQADADADKAFMDALDEMIRTAISFLKQMQDAEIELMASASRI